MLHLLQIREEIRRFGINIYQFPECDSDEEDDFKRQDQILKVSVSNKAFFFFFKAFLCGVTFTTFAAPCRGVSHLQWLEATYRWRPKVASSGVASIPGVW